MEQVLFLFLRRMRAPLLVLLLAFAISIGGLVLIPGQDFDGNPWKMDFLHAFYFVSFMGSTIGFGEIPYPFTPAQRLWVTFCIFLTVIAWLYAIGKIISLMQDQTFSRAVSEARFIYKVRAIQSPFYIVCGYGEAGSLLVPALARRGVQTVVIEKNPDRLNELVMAGLPMDIPSLCADASIPKHLVEAGLRRSLCRGVVANTDDNAANVKIAVVSKLLRPPLRVICRATTREAASNMASFNTDYIINPYEVFAEHMAMALRRPSVHQLHAILISLAGRPLVPPVHPPEGKWVICGYGRFGRAVHAAFEREGLPMTVIESDPEHAPPDSVIGSATDPGPLEAAGIRGSVGIVAGTDCDADNLSIVMTARALNPDLYQVARQDWRGDTEVFKAAKLDLVMEASRVTVWRMLPLITTPLLSNFLRTARTLDEDWAGKLISNIRKICHDRTPETWAVRIDEEDAHAINDGLLAGKQITIQTLMRDARDRDRLLRCIPLLLDRDGQQELLPDPETPLKVGDKLLFTGAEGCERRMDWVLLSAKELEYVESGIERPDGLIWRWLASLYATRPTLKS